MIPADSHLKPHELDAQTKHLCGMISQFDSFVKAFKEKNPGDDYVADPAIVDIYNALHNLLNYDMPEGVDRGSLSTHLVGTMEASGINSEDWQ